MILLFSHIEIKITEFGEEKAREYAKANELAIKKYKEIIERENINCDFEEKPAYVYSLGKVDMLERECEAAKKLKIDAQFVKEANLPFKINGAVKFNNQAQFNPLKFLECISQDLTIYENTRALEIKENLVVTDKGSISANNIVVATHYPIMNIPGYYFLKMHQERSYVLALKDAGNVDGMYIDVEKVGYSFRNYKDLLLLGGIDQRTGDNEKGSSYEKMRASAMIISDIILGKQNDFSEIFSPKRFDLSLSIRNIANDMAQTTKNFIAQKIRIPSSSIEQIQNGHGGIVEYDGQKVGVYKNEEGETFIVSTKCSHLGCELKWNADELTWDCPCHGSRFDYKGRLISSPAVKDLLED